MIAIVDYGMGNLRSIQKGLEHMGYPATVTSSPEEVMAAAGVVLPGVGAFGKAMANLEDMGLVEPLRLLAGARPLLGICLGLQLLFDGSEEDGWHQGLGLLAGQVVRLPSGVKVPHMGWNQLHLRRPSALLQGIADHSHFYFVHSYYAQPEDPGMVVATTGYGVELAAVVSRGLITGIQFHPEKSSSTGLAILKNFGELVANGGLSSN